MKQTINFPCVMVEKSNTYNRNTILNQFAIINNEIELAVRQVYFIHPVITNNHNVVNEAIKINNSFDSCLN